MTPTQGGASTGAVALPQGSDPFSVAHAHGGLQTRQAPSIMALSGWSRGAVRGRLARDCAITNYHAGTNQTLHPHDRELHVGMRGGRSQAAITANSRPSACRRRPTFVSARRNATSSSPSSWSSTSSPVTDTVLRSSLNLRARVGELMWPPQPALDCLSTSDIMFLELGATRVISRGCAGSGRDVLDHRQELLGR